MAENPGSWLQTPTSVTLFSPSEKKIVMIKYKFIFPGTEALSLQSKVSEKGLPWWHSG